MANPRFDPGSSTWAKGSTVTSDSELHRRFGANASEVFLPAIVKQALVKESATKKKMRHLECTFCLGGDTTKAIDVALSSAKLKPPDSTPTPHDLVLFIDSGGELPLEDKESLATQPESVTLPPQMSQSQDTHTPTQSTFVPSQMSQVRRVSTDGGGNSETSITAHGTDWHKDNDATPCNVNGRHANLAWSVRDEHRTFILSALTDCKA